MSAEKLTVAEIKEQRQIAASEVKGAGKKELIIVGILLLALLLYPLLPIITGSNYNYSLHLLLFTFLYIAMASSWNILGGYTGYISLGHNVFFAVGGYLAGVLLLYYGLSPFLTWPLAGLAALLVRYLCQHPETQQQVLHVPRQVQAEGGIGDTHTVFQGAVAGEQTVKKKRHLRLW